MTTSRFHADWLSLVEISGPFLTLPVLTRAFPAGLEPTDLELVEELRVAYAEVSDDPGLSERWVRWVLDRLLGLPESVLRHRSSIPGRFSHRVAEQGAELRPDFAVVDPDRGDVGEPRARLLVVEWPWGTPLDERPDESSWAASPIDRLEELCRATGVRLGLVTNGETWTLVDAPVGEASGTATWDADLWLEERATLDAFTTLLGARRFFTVSEDETLESLLNESANAEAEVTDQLGRQVRAAVALLVDSWSRINRGRSGLLFGNLAHAEVYEGAVTVLMRLVFLLCAEERGLFLLGDQIYDTSYAVSTLRAQLEEEANTYGEDVLERHTGAWHRLLATFRMVYAGAHHENLSLPAYGGSLFDPERFPWIEGRYADDVSHSSRASLPVDDRTVLHILDALQVLRFSGRGGTSEARRLSFRALDVEQIGHVYEGLLDHGAVAVADVVLGLSGKKEPELTLEDVEAHAGRGGAALEAWLAEQTGVSATAVSKARGLPRSPEEISRLASACDNDHALADRIGPYLGLLRRDLRGLPQVWLPGSIVMTQSSDRRSSGTYYTPRALAEEIVRYSLEPLVYQPGPAEGFPPDQWRLRPSAELLDLRVCDLAMGSGAFLVATCRYLAARLLEAWSLETVSPGDPVGPPGGALTPLPSEETDREILALRLVTDRCIYGVDRNPMATEMAKLSLWLVALAKDRPFSFVDHALRVGDSLLGITRLSQLEYLDLDPDRGARLHGGTLFDPATVIAPLVDDAVRKRRELESFLVIDVTDAAIKRQLFEAARADLEALIVVGNLVVGACLSTATQSDDAAENRLFAVAPDVRAALAPDQQPNNRAARLEDLRLRAEYWLDEGRPAMAPDRRCLHWPLEFPEVFLDTGATGFDAIVGNPPFLGGVALARTFGEPYERFMKGLVAESIGFVDLAAYFHRRAQLLISPRGVVGLLGPQNLVNSANRTASTDAIMKHGKQIGWARQKVKWPGTASQYVCAVAYMPGAWAKEPVLDGMRVPSISASLDAEIDLTELSRLRPWVTYSQGTDLYGASFVKSAGDWETFVHREPDLEMYLRPYVNADILCSTTESKSDLLAVDFGDRDKSELTSVSATVAYLEQSVGRERSEQTRQIHERRPWLHWDKRLKSYELARQSPIVLACPNVSKHLPMLMVESLVLFSKTTKFFPNAGFDIYGLLQSNPFLVWAFITSPLREDRIAFSTQSSLDTFPPPAALSSLAQAGEALCRERESSTRSRLIGITDLLNLVHDQKIDAIDIVELRQRQVELDYAVTAAYGWQDLSLNHDFWETRQGTRFTVAPEVRVELLGRLLQLNHTRYSEELRLGFHTTRTKRNASGKAPPRSAEPVLFEVEQ